MNNTLHIQILKQPMDQQVDIAQQMTYEQYCDLRHNIAKMIGVKTRTPFLFCRFVQKPNACRSVEVKIERSWISNFHIFVWTAK